MMLLFQHQLMQHVSELTAVCLFGVLFFNFLYIDAFLERKFDVLRSRDRSVIEQDVFLSLEPFQDGRRKLGRIIPILAI